MRETASACACGSAHIPAASSVCPPPPRGPASLVVRHAVYVLAHVVGRDSNAAAARLQLHLGVRVAQRRRDLVSHLRRQVIVPGLATFLDPRRT